MLHDGAHVVVDDAGIGFHGGVENVGVNIGGFTGLVHLDGNVFNQVGVEFVDGQFELELGKERLVATYGGYKISQAVLQARKADEVFIVNFLVEIALRLFNQDGDLLKPLQIPYRGGEEQASDRNRQLL